MSQCKKFTPNIFHKTKCSNCFRQKEEHSAEALECNRASRSIARSGYLFVAPDWDFSVPLNRTKRWQRRWFVLYDDGELTYSVDEHPDTVPQGAVDMCKVMEVTGAEQITGHPHSLALTSPDRVTFVKAASREDARWWVELLAVFPRRHKRNATFPGGRASPSLPQLGRSASPQPPRPRHLSVTGPSPRTNFETPPLKERESPPKEQNRKPEWATSGRINSLPIETPATSNYSRSDGVVSSGSPPTRDKLRCDDKVKTRRDWRNERLRDIATALTDRSPESSLALPAEGLLHMKKGWLWMKTSNDWVRRWIVLYCPTLQVYPNQDELGTPELTVELSTVTSCVEVPTDSKYGFEIHWTGPTLTLSAVTQGIRANWLQALKKTTPMSSDCNVTMVESPISPSTPRSLLASSDEEYRTASEGGRRGSEDWSELPPSPPLNKTSLSRVKERARLRAKLPRSQSRQSTLDSTSTDELDCAKEPENVHLLMNSKQNEEINDLRKKLYKAEEDVRLLEEEIARLKKIQSDATIREKKAKEMLSNFEKSEMELNQRNSQIELNFLKEQRALQRRLSEFEESSRMYEEKCNILSRDLQTKQRMAMNLQEELDGSNERLMKERDENDKLFKRIQELEGKFCFRNKMFNTDSIIELTNINLDLDIDELNQNELKEYCLDLMCRFERAIVEIRAVRRALRESEDNCDRLELANFGLNNKINLMKKEKESEIKLLVQRLDHLTSKLTSAEKQLKIKAKTELKDKRRSLSLKGRESVSINKEVEDKVTELEAKIIALERGRNRRKYKRERSSERGSPIDDKSLRRLRRKSLDSATTSEPMKLLMRLSSLESKVTNVDASNESLNTLHGSLSDLTKSKEETNMESRNNVDVEYLLATAKIKVSECLQSVGILKNSNRKRASSPSLDRLITLENSLNELLDILNKRDCAVTTAEVEVINSSAGAVVKQLQTLLVEKLTSLAEKKRLLRENNNWDSMARLQMLAEKVAYENILIGRIQEALMSPVTGEAVCERLIGKEIKETAYLIIALQTKINGANEKPLPCRTSADYLSKVLAKCLVSAAHGFKSCKNFITATGPSIKLLCEEKQNLDTLLATYKNAKLPQLADYLAAETISLASDKTCRLQSLSDGTVNEFSKTAREVVNAELIRSEINHVLLRAAQIYQSNIDADNSFFFSFFASERAALELWSDSVGDCLFDEVNRTITELTEHYQNSLNKMLKQNWRCKVELERNTRTPNSLLHEYAEIIAHKALIDARIAVLSGQYIIPEDRETRCSLSSWLENEKYWSHIEDQSLMQINQSLEAEFSCMVDKYSGDCFALLVQPELEEVLGYLNELASKVIELQKFLRIPLTQGDSVLRSWSDVCQKCINLRNDLEDIRTALEESNTFRYHPEDQRKVYLGTEYLSQVENLRAAYRRALTSCEEHHNAADIEQLQNLCEKVLQAMEQWHRRTIQEMREVHAQEVEILKQDKEQALAEETQATLAALDAMKKAHVAEVQREVAKFKQEFVRQKRDDIFDLSEKLSVKSLEAAALEEQLGSATRQLAHAQQHILMLERNSQISSMQN